MSACAVNEPGSYGLIDSLTQAQIYADLFLVRIKKIGFCGSDLKTFRALNPIGGYSRLPGHEIAAEIVEIGTKIAAGLNVGTKVLVLP